MTEPHILLAEDHGILRQAIKLTFQITLRRQVVLKGVGSCAALMKELSRSAWTHLILDINLEDGSSLDLLPSIRRLYPAMKILVLSQNPVDIYGGAVENRYGVEYASKNLSNEEVTAVLERFVFGKGSDKTKKTGPGNAASPFFRLSARQLELLPYFFRGLSSGEMAQELGVTVSTISHLKRQVFEKLEVTNVMQLRELAALHQIPTGSG